MLAEQLLARACENEAENAKRMRMGIEPVSQSLPSQIVTSQVSHDTQWLHHVTTDQALDSVTGGRRSILLWAKIHTSASEVLVKYTS